LQYAWDLGLIVTGPQQHIAKRMQAFLLRVANSVGRITSATATGSRRIDLFFQWPTWDRTSMAAGPSGG
jgi:hypothetical protein